MKRYLLIVLAFVFFSLSKQGFAHAMISYGENNLSASVISDLDMGACNMNPATTGKFSKSEVSYILEPAAPLSAEITGGTTICEGSSTNLLVTFTGGVSPYTFTYNDGTTDITIQNIKKSVYKLNVSPISTTSYSLKSVTDSKGNIGTITGNLQTVTVNKKSGDPTEATATPSTICSGSGTALSLRGGGGGSNEVIKWYMGSCGGTLVGSGNNLTVNPTFTTTYYGRYEDGAPCNYQSACVSVTVNVNAKQTPSVSITALPGDTVCEGTYVTLIAATVNTGGGLVNYNFKVNNISVQNGSSDVFFTTSLMDGDLITCDITITNGMCLNTATASSNEISMTVNSSFTPSITITAKNGSVICGGTPVKFAAKASSTGGGSVNYNFRVNDKSVQNGSSKTYYTDSLADKDVVDCEITITNASCLTSSTASSNKIAMTVNSSFTPSVSITASPGFSVCQGDNVTFTASATNTGGDSINYNFKINGKSVQDSLSSTYSTDSLADNDSIYCEITVMNVPCLIDSMVSSDIIAMTVNQKLTPKVLISTSTRDTICAGIEVTFTATASNTGNGTVKYNFLVNNASKQNNSSNIYSTTTLANNDVINCIITDTGGTCLNSNTASSNIISMTVNPELTSSVSISVSPGDTICQGTMVTFTAIAGSTGGGAVNYNFKVNNVTKQNDTSNIFNTAVLSNGDSIDCAITVAGGTCVISPTALSNKISMTVNPAPTVSPISDTVYCNGVLGKEIIFTSFPTQDLFSWISAHNIGFGISGSGNIPEFTTYNSSMISKIFDTITVNATANGCPSAPYAFHITVNPTPLVDATPSVAYCNGVNTQSINFTSATPASTFEWLNSDTTIGLASSGTDSIRSFIATNLSPFPKISFVHVHAVANGCSGPDSSFSITVNPSPPRPLFTSLQPNSTMIKLCEGSKNINFNVDSPKTSLIYQWSANPRAEIDIGNVTNPNTVLSFNSVGSYTLKVVVHNNALFGGCPDSASQLAMISSNTHSIIERKIVLKQPGNILIYPDNSMAPDSGYQWGYDLKLNDSTLGYPYAIPGQVYQLFVPATEFLTQTGDQLDTFKYCFWILLKDDSCRSKVYYNGPYSRNKLAQESLSDTIVGVSVYPNPNSGSFNISLYGKIYGNIEARIYNALSQVVFQSDFIKKKYETTQVIKNLNLSNGIYLLELLSSDHQKVISRIMISN